MKQDHDNWDWPSIADRFQTLANFLPKASPDSIEELAEELESMARWMKNSGFDK